jgi:hypothetical protein
LRTIEGLEKAHLGRPRSGRQHLTVKCETAQKHHGVVATLLPLLHDKGVLGGDKTKETKAPVEETLG